MSEDLRFSCPARSTPASCAEGSGQAVPSLGDPIPVQEILDLLPCLVMVLDADRRTLFVNQALGRLLQEQGLPADLGLRPGESLRCVNALLSGKGCGTADACQHCGALQAIKGAMRGGQERRECHLLVEHAGGIRAFNFSVSASPLRAGDVTHTLVALTDISDEKIRKSLQQVFFHDVLNTATAVSWFARMLHSGAEADRVAALENLSVTSDRLLEEIRSQRMLVDAESGELKVTWVPVDTRRALEDVVHSSECCEAAAQRSLHLDPHAVAVEVRSDRALLGRVLTNMVINALEATPPGGSVLLGCDRDGDDAVFWVHNAGAIPQEVQGQIFHRSFSTRGPRRGLGTYGMKLLGENHLGGKVGFATSPREGTTFHLRLPATPGPSQEASGQA